MAEEDNKTENQTETQNEVAAAPVKKVAKKKVAKKKVAKKVAVSAAPAAQPEAPAKVSPPAAKKTVSPRKVDDEVASKLREMGLLVDGSESHKTASSSPARRSSSKNEALGAASGLFNLLYAIMAVGVVILVALVLKDAHVSVPGFAGGAMAPVGGAAAQAPQAAVAPAQPMMQKQPVAKLPSQAASAPEAQPQMTQPLPPDHATWFQAGGAMAPIGGKAEQAPQAAVAPKQPMMQQKPTPRLPSQAASAPEAQPQMTQPLLPDQATWFQAGGAMTLVGGTDAQAPQAAVAPAQPQMMQPLPPEQAARFQKAFGQQ